MHPFQTIKKKFIINFFMIIFSIIFYIKYRTISIARMMMIICKTMNNRIAKLFKKHFFFKNDDDNTQSNE